MEQQTYTIREMSERFGLPASSARSNTAPFPLPSCRPESPVPPP